MTIQNIEPTDTKKLNQANYEKAKDRVFTVRLSQEEADRLNALVEQTGVTKGALIRAAIGNIQVKPISSKINEQMIKEVNAIGNNINQLTALANGANSMGLPLPGLAAKLKEFKEVMDSIEARL